MYQNIYDITVKRHNLDSMTRIVEHITSKITYIIFSVLWTKLKLYHSCLCLCYSSIWLRKRAESDTRHLSNFYNMPSNHSGIVWPRNIQTSICSDLPDKTVWTTYWPLEDGDG